MGEEGWINNHCLEDPGFSRLLFACMDRLGIYECSEYTSREYEDRGTLRCEMIIYVGRRSRFPDIHPWNVTAKWQPERLCVTYVRSTRSTSDILR